MPDNEESMIGGFCRILPARVLALALLAGAVFLCFGCSTSSVAFKEGLKAEEQKDYDNAVIDFQKALKTQPGNAGYLLHEKNARTLAAIYHYQRGRQFLAEGRTEDAAGEFQTAVSIDPSNEAAAQELRVLLEEKAAAKARQESAIRHAMEQREQAQSAGAVELQPLSRTLLPELDISGNSEYVFEALGRIAGINVAFYHDFQPHRIHLDLDNVTIGAALKTAAAEAGVFWKVITPNTILIVMDTPSNRQYMGTQVLKTVYLRNPSLNQQDSLALVNAVKQVIGIRVKTIYDAEADAIVLYGSQDEVDAAASLIHSLDRGEPEVLIDVSVLEADEDNLRDLGLAPVPVTGTSTIGALGFNPSTSITTTSSSGTTSTTPYLGLNQLGKLNTSDFSVVLSGFEANALLNNSNTQILDNPQVRVTAGQKTDLNIGEKIPYATGSFGVPEAGTTSTSYGLLANTQFQYMSVGVELKMQPAVTANGDIILNATVDVSSEGTPVNIGGIDEPVVNQRNITQIIRLREGESSLLGGLLSTTTNEAVSGLPGLGSIPILRYLFSTEQHEVIKQEVVIMMTPYIIRLPATEAASDFDPALPAMSAPPTARKTFSKVKP
jgi:general secretion pathway protein D